MDAKIHWRVTTVIADANAPGGIRETPLDYAEPHSSIEVETIDYIWREAMRRNNWILEQGGERVKVFVRKMNGTICNCPDHHIRDLEYGKQPSNRCHICFVPGTLVRSESGFQPIEEIQVGDKVLTQDGTFQKVSKRFESDYEGNLVGFRSSVSTNLIYCTPEHPFLKLGGAHQNQILKKCGPKCNSYIKNGDGLGTSGSVRQLPSKRWWARVQVNGRRGKGRVALGTHGSKEEAQEAIQKYLREVAEPGHHLIWADASTLELKDWVVPQWPRDVKDYDYIEVPHRYRKNTILGTERLGPTKFRVDEDFLWMVGLYLAEGSTSSRTVSFTLHKDELSYQQRLFRFFGKLGYNPKLYSSSNGSKAVNVGIHSTTLAQWFRDWFGTGCQNKKVPEELMSLPPEKTWHIAMGVYDGDGSTRDREITQTSEILALQLVEILHRNGEQPLVRNFQSEILTPKGNKRKRAYTVSWAEDTLLHENRKGRWNFKEHCLSQICQMTNTPFSGKVYNLEVEGNHTYVVQGVVTHNCFGTGYVGGYEGPYDMIIVPDDAERRISQLMTGRRLEHSYEVWTGASPLLTQRDFIVKQTNERYSVGGVRRPSARGNVMQQHFTIAYLDEQDIRYQVCVNDPAALPWPETRHANVPPLAYP
ncbi:MAG: Hint domain-containing protein, partial [Bacteroidota bacterium]